MSAGVLLLGAAGRMGRALARLLAEEAEPGLKLVAALERPGHPDVGREVAPGVALTDDWAAALSAGPAVAVDFSHFSATADNARRLSSAGVAWVLGTTGIDGDGREAVAAAAGRVAVLQSANMSLGVHLLAALARKAAEALKGKGYDCEVVERHHRHKKDAPSGTALLLGRAAAEGFGWELDDVRKDGRSGQTGERPEREIGFHAVRAGGIVGEHEVVFASEGETVSLSHSLGSRDTLAAGALKAAAWLAEGRAPGLYGMEDVLGL
jgi:4-hydroxy-tetrahydrodipicolinate reductase